MDSPSNKVLITGLSGFTGTYLKKFLEEKQFRVYGIAHESIGDSIFKCDITDRVQVSEVLQKVRPNFIIHLAAISFVQHEDILQIYDVNVKGTQNLLDASLEIKESLKKIILASSATVYGNSPHEKLSEEMCPNPVNHYGISKLAMEQIAKTYFSKLPILITRPFNYTAPGHGEQFVIPKIARAFIDRKPELELGNLEVYREYNSIDFVCDVYYRLMTSAVVSEIVNIASGETHSLKEIIRIFEEKSGHKVDIKINPLFVRKDEIKTLSGDTKKLERIIHTLRPSSIDGTINSFLKSEK